MEDLLDTPAAARDGPDGHGPGGHEPIRFQSPWWTFIGYFADDRWHWRLYGASGGEIGHSTVAGHRFFEDAVRVAMGHVARTAARRAPEVGGRG